MKLTPTALPGVVVIEPTVFGDHRGFFVETYREDEYQRLLGSEVRFVQDNHSRSSRGVLRGLHFQTRRPQGKLLRVAKGRIFDVALDIDPASDTFGRWFGAELSGEDHKQIYIPPGYAHGFQVLSESADVLYKCTDYYDPDGESGVIWNDPDAAIEWPLEHPTVSDKDRGLSTLAALFR